MACCDDSTCSAAAPPAALNSPRWRRALWIALLINAGFFVAEIVAGAAAGSAALQADGAPGLPSPRAAPSLPSLSGCWVARHGTPFTARCRAPR